MNIEFKRKGTMTSVIREKNGVVWISHKIFDAFPKLNMAYSTRIGGVSTGVCSSMNLRNCEWDTIDNYKTNLHLFCDAAGFDHDRIVATAQTHTSNVVCVHEKDAPKGTLFDSHYENVDGLVTNVPGITLLTSFADCIPVFLYDPVQNAIGSCHSGWKGTLGQIGKRTVELMTKEYKSRPEDIIAGIGPGICRDCYEVSDDLYEMFSAVTGP